jgi:hypothetical protein
MSAENPLESMFRLGGTSCPTGTHARQAGGHCFEPSTAHLISEPKVLLAGGLWLFLVGVRHPAKTAKSARFAVRLPPQTSPHERASAASRSVCGVPASRTPFAACVARDVNRRLLRSRQPGDHEREGQQ